MLPTCLEVAITDSRDRGIDSMDGDSVAVSCALSALGLASLAVQGKVMVTGQDGVR